MAALADRVELIDRVSAEDESRAHIYSLLGTLLSSPPSAETLSTVMQLSGGAGDFGRAMATLAKLAASTSPVAVHTEYQELFIGLGRGELLPYASYYLTGFLQEKPLAQLRRDMARLGIDRADEGHDPEDHVASVLEMMSGLIDGRFGTPSTLAEQREFFNRHVVSWMPVFFRDLEGAQASVFYAALGPVGRIFLDIEANAFEMV